MQKLVTICLSGSKLDHGAVEEHLANYLSEGWRIASVCAAGGPSGNGTVWLAAVLEKGVHPVAPQVEYPQTDEGRPVPPSNVPVGPETPLKVGSRVLAFSQGRWWRADVIGLEPGDRVKLHFPGWDAKWDTVVPRAELQVDPNAPPG
jgi:hypothetical protein